MRARFLAERRAGSAAFSCWHLVAIGALWATREPALLAAFSLLALGAITWSGRKRWTPNGSFGWANALTWSRIVATAVLLVLPMSAWPLAALALLIFSLDGVDGWIARKLGSSSAFGASLDKECDAFFVMAVCALLWLQGLAGLWVLVAGLWRYCYGLLLAISPGKQQAPRSNLGRYSYSTACVSLILALVPHSGAALYLAGFANVVISLSFLRSLYYSFLRS